MRALHLTLWSAITALTSTTTHAQPEYSWQVYDMHSEGAISSEGLGMSRAGAAGNISWDWPRPSGASLWMGSEAMWLLLREQDRSGIPLANGADENTQCGYDVPGEWAYAALWFGTRDSVLNLHPGDPYLVSDVFDVSDEMAAGSVGIHGKRHAAVWTTDPLPMMIDLHNGPQNGNSTAYATDGRWQGGTSSPNAVLWKGTPESMVIMDPPAPYCCGGISGMAIPEGADVGTQVGTMLTRDDFDQVRDHAILWHDTPESWIDMHPSFHPRKNSYMWGTTGDIHCGQVNGHAGIWFGDDPDSFLDLHQFIDPPPQGASRAVDIDIYDGIVYIAGRGTYEVDGRVGTHALVWVGTPDGGKPGGDRPAPRAAGTPNPAQK